MKIILASKSPRRKEILENLGIKFDIIVSEADEDSGEKDPSLLVRELSLRKGRAVADAICGSVTEDTYIISSDTVVAAENESGVQEILGKPRDLSDARRMLSLIEGRSHFVHSGIAVIKLTEKGSREEFADRESTLVEFSHMTESEIEFYISNESVLDKAGAYAIQGIASAWINKIDGDYFNVVGLPVCKMFELFKSNFGIEPSNMINQKN